MATIKKKEKEIKSNNIPDKIVQMNAIDQYMSDMARYSIYILFERFVPNFQDGLKPVQRRTLYCMWNNIKCHSLATKRKSANTTGETIAFYHPHCLRGDTVVFLLNNTNNTITTMRDLYSKGIVSFESLGVDPSTMNTIPIIVRDLRIGQYTNKVYHIEFSNGAEICCTSNHPFLLIDGSYKQAKDLTLNDTPYIVNHYISSSKVDSLHITNIWIEEVDNEPMYDFTVDTCQNMLFPLIGSNDNYDLLNYPMVCLHNSADSVYETMKTLTNWFECKMPLICYDSASGSIQGGPQSAARYTESYLSPFAMDVIFGDLEESRQVIDWHKTFDNHTIEPTALPVKIPLLLVNGNFSIAIGERNESPTHSLNDVIDVTIKVLHNPNARVELIPDPCHKCEIIDTDWGKISRLGFGFYYERGIIDIITSDKDIYLSIRSVPNLVWPDTIMETINNLIKNGKLPQIKDIIDYSSANQLDIRLYLKSGSDPLYVKQFLYKNTSLQAKKRVNFKVIVQDGPMLDLKHFSYKAYILAFLDFRREVKFRLYNSRLQKVETRLHAIDTYIKILESGHIEEIVHAIRNRSAANENMLIEWLVNLLKITDLQAKFILNTQLKALSRTSLLSYKDEQKKLMELVKFYINIITTPALIDKEIEEELLSIKAKYGRPRQSILITEAKANNIPEMSYNIIFYNNGMIKKIEPNMAVRGVKNAIEIASMTVMNSESILVFDNLGRVYKLHVYKIPLCRNDPIHLQSVLKNFNGNIVTAIASSVIDILSENKNQYFVVICTSMGYIKKLDVNDVINSVPSGTSFSKLNKGDSICKIELADSTNDIIIYTPSKILRTSMANIPYLKRTAIGNIAMKTNEPIRGISLVLQDCKYIIIVSVMGKIFKLLSDSIKNGPTNRSGIKVVKLDKNDYILAVYSCNDSSILSCRQISGKVINLSVSSLSIDELMSSGSLISNESLIGANVISL